MMLKVGWIDYANCTPLLLQIQDKLPTDGISLIHGVPAHLNQSLATGAIDICISSSIEYSRHSNEYAILPGHCIGSDGPVMSVMLLSRRPVSELVGSRILVTPESATSVILLRVLLERFWKIPGCQIEEFPGKWEDALSSGLPVMLIGDAALKATLESDIPYCYDFGAAWKEFTGLPFVYAVWQLNEASISGKLGELAALSSLLGDARDYLPERIDELAEKASERSWIGSRQLADYWRHITYRLDELHQRGLMLFYAHASELGLVPRVNALNFFKV